MEREKQHRAIFDKLLSNTSIFRGGGKASKIYKEKQKCSIKANNEEKSLDIWFKIDSKGGGQTQLMVRIGMHDLSKILHRAMEVDYQRVYYAMEKAKDNIRIDTLGLSARSFNSLDRADIKYFGELGNMSGNEIKNIKNIGSKSYDEIIGLLKEYSSQMEIDCQNGLLKILDGAMEIDRQGAFDVIKAKAATYKNLNIDSLGFSARTFNTLNRAGILTLGELEDMTKNEIANIKNLGERSLDEIIETIKEYSL